MKTTFKFDGEDGHVGEFTLPLQVNIQVDDTWTNNEWFTGERVDSKLMTLDGHDFRMMTSR